MKFPNRNLWSLVSRFSNLNYLLQKPNGSILQYLGEYEFNHNGHRVHSFNLSVSIVSSVVHTAVHPKHLISLNCHAAL